jgi:hypothetical protein
LSISKPKRARKQTPDTSLLAARPRLRAASIHPRNDFISRR